MSAVDHASLLRELPSDQPLIMGVLNTTPDSFSDGGEWGTADRAVAQAERMLGHGAHVIDVGGESSRPGAHPVERTEELDRVLPVIERLAGRCVISIDTAKAEVAEAALSKGASIVNDITASLEDVAGSHSAGWIAMHMQGEPRTMQHNPAYDDVVREVAESLDEYRLRGERAGVEHLWVDPGFGFGKTTSHNLALLRDLALLRGADGSEALGSTTPSTTPLLIGVSRKRFLGEIHATADSEQNATTGSELSAQGGESEVLVDANDRIEGSVMAAVWSWANSAHMVRTHDVRVTGLAAAFLHRSNGK